MDTLLTILHVLVCLFLVGVVLLQQGKGADIGATFGGSSQSLFGTEGPLPLLNKITTTAAVIFMLTSLLLAYISSQSSSTSVMGDLESPIPAVVEPVPQTEPEKMAIEEKLDGAVPGAESVPGQMGASSPGETAAAAEDKTRPAEKE